MSSCKCGIKVIRENKPPLYDTTLCEKPISYHRKQSEIRTKGKR